MKVVSTIILCCLVITGCKTQNIGMCSTGHVFTGEGLQSELNRFETVGVVDTVLASIDIKVTLLRTESVEKNGIGVSIIVKQSEKDEIFIGGVTGAEGDYKTFLQAGVYDFEFSYFGYNSLILKNIKLKFGEMKEFGVRLGSRGENNDVYKVYLDNM